MSVSYPKVGGGTGTAEGRHYAVMMALKYIMVSLELPQFPNDQIEVLKQPFNRGILRSTGDNPYSADGSAAMVISPLRRRLLKRKNRSRDIEYTSLVTVFEASNLDNIEGLDEHCDWDDRITDRFDDYPFNEIAGGQRVTINPQDFNPLQTWLKGFDCQTYAISTLLCVSRPWPIS